MQIGMLPLTNVVVHFGGSTTYKPFDPSAFFAEFSWLRLDLLRADDLRGTLHVASLPSLPASNKKARSGFLRSGFA